MSDSTSSILSNPAKFRVVLLTHGGSDHVLRELIQLAGIEVVGVFIEPENTKQYALSELIRRSIRYDGYGATLIKFVNPQKIARRFVKSNAMDGNRASGGHEKNIYDELVEVARQHDVPVHFVDNYHNPEARELIQATRPDLGVVYGTNILKETVFGIPRLGSINMHQGLVPYYRGGPVMFWELFNGEHEIGITVHFVHAKVDTGEVILQERIPFAYDYRYKLDYDKFIADFRQRFMRERSGRLIAQAVRRIADGTAKTWTQDLAIGKRYRMPTKAEKDELRRRLKTRMKQVAKPESDAATTEREPAKSPLKPEGSTGT